MKAVSVSILLIFFIKSVFSQCNDAAKYINGKFKVIQYDSLWNATLLPDEFEKFNLYTKATIEKENEQLMKGHLNGIMDGDGICGNLYLNAFFSKEKCALFNVYGKRLTDFKYDDFYTYIPTHQNYDNKYTKTDIWNQYFLTKNKNAFALINKEGKELTAFEYGIPYIEVNTDYDRGDTVLLTAKKTIIVSDSINCGDCTKGWNILNYPLAGKSLILMKDDKLGSIDSSGKTIIPFIYEKIKIYMDVVETDINNKKVFYTINGKEISRFEQVKPIFLSIKNEGYTTRNIIFSGIYAVKKNNKWGFINGNKDEMIKCIFEDEEPDFNLAIDMYSVYFVHEKKGIKVEVKYNELKLLDDDERDVTSKFIRKL